MLTTLYEVEGKQIAKHLQEHYEGYEQMCDLTNNLIDATYHLLGRQRIVLAVDEMNVIATLHQDKFLSPSDKFQVDVRDLRKKVYYDKIPPAAKRCCNNNAGEPKSSQK